MVRRCHAEFVTSVTRALHAQCTKCDKLGLQRGDVAEAGAGRRRRGAINAQADEAWAAEAVAVSDERWPSAGCARRARRGPRLRGRPECAARCLRRPPRDAAFA